MGHFCLGGEATTLVKRHIRRDSVFPQPLQELSIAFPFSP
jgi:hypothetical protein